MQSLASYGSDSDSDSSINTQQPVASTSTLPTTATVPAPARLVPSTSASATTTKHPTHTISGVRLAPNSNAATSAAQQSAYRAPRAKSRSPPPYVRAEEPGPKAGLRGSDSPAGGEGNGNGNGVGDRIGGEEGRGGGGEGLSIRGLATAGHEGGGVLALKAGSLAEFGIPPVLVDPEGVKPSVQAKLANFHRLAATRGLHFNDNLAASKAFRNPRIHNKLVKFIDLGGGREGECGTNWAEEVWDPVRGLAADATAARIGERQHELSLARQAGQAAGSGRTAVAFTSASASGGGGKEAALRVRDGLARKEGEKEKDKGKRSRWDKAGGAGGVGRERSKSPRR